MSANNERECHMCGGEEKYGEVIRKDDHDRDICENCWEEMPDWVCSRCDHEFRGNDDDCCPGCSHHPEDPGCPCGCKVDEEDEEDKEDEDGEKDWVGELFDAVVSRWLEDPDRMETMMEFLHDHPSDLRDVFEDIMDSEMGDNITDEDLDEVTRRLRIRFPREGA